jgi:hypothetical protein
VNNAAMRWPMQPTKMPTRSQRASRVITASLIVATTFVMHAMVERRSSQLKMPRPDAYEEAAVAQTRQDPRLHGAAVSVNGLVPRATTTWVRVRELGGGCSGEEKGRLKSLSSVRALDGVV